jgi:hypothetical protein
MKLSTNPQQGMENLTRVFKQAHSIDIDEGRLGYFRYQVLMRRIAFHYGYTLRQAAGCFCALSPNSDYVGNLRSVVTVMKGHRAGAAVENVTTSSFTKCKLRAWRILEGEDFESFTQGLKTLNFYYNIIRPDDPKPVTIDGHMKSVWVGRLLTMKEAHLQVREYDVIAEGCRNVAKTYGILANQLQQILWFTWKRIHNVKYQGDQLYLFGRDDQWGLKLRVEDIKPFPIKGLTVKS